MSNVGIRPIGDLVPAVVKWTILFTLYTACILEEML